MAVGSAQAHVVRGTLVGEACRGGEGIVNDEAARVVKNGPKYRRRGRSLERSVELAHEIRGSEMNTAVGGVGGGRNGRGIRGPHARRARTRGEKVGRLAERRRKDSCIVPFKTEEPQCRCEAAFLGRKHALRNAEAMHEAHLREALEGGGPRIACLTTVSLGSQVADTEASVVMRGTHEAVEVDLDGGRNGQT
jgi:hypothetical protein